MLETDERIQRALSLALAELNQRERSVSEVRALLERRAIGAEAATAAVRMLIEQGLLDDARFALMFVHDKRELEGWGSERIRRELGRRGIDDDLIETSLAREQAERATEETELDRALELLRRRYPAAPRERRERDRALGVLIRKGYESELALDALAAYARDG